MILIGDCIGATYTWQGGAKGGAGSDGTNLFKAANWSQGGFTARNSDLIFTNINDSPSSILNVSASATLNSITYGVGALSFTLTNSTFQLTLNGGTNIIDYSTNMETLSVGIVLGGDATWKITNGAHLAINSTVSDGAASYGITMIGGGTLSLKDANTFNGGFTLSTGTLILGNSLALGFSGSGGTGAVSVSGAGTIRAGVSGLQIGNAIHLSTNCLTLDAAGYAWIHSGPISGNGGGINVVSTGSPGTMTLSGSNSYTGSTFIQDVLLSLGVGGLLGNTSGIQIASGGGLLLTESNQVNSLASLTLQGGKISMVSASSSARTSYQALASLTLTTNSLIDFGALSGASTLNFGSISGLSSHTLNVYNWNGTTLWGETSTPGGAGQYTHLLDASSGMLSSAELSHISFYSGAGTGFLGTGGIMGHEIIPVPEPAVIITPLLILMILPFFMRIEWRLDLPQGH